MCSGGICSVSVYSTPSVGQRIWHMGAVLEYKPQGWRCVKNTDRQEIATILETNIYTEVDVTQYFSSV